MKPPGTMVCSIPVSAGAVLVDSIVDEARLEDVGAPRGPEPPRDDLGRSRGAGQEVRQRRARIEIFGRGSARGAGAPGQIDPVLHLQVLDTGLDLVILKAWQW